MIPKLFKKNTQVERLGFFLVPVPVYYICPPVAWGQAVAQADDIFGDDPNTLV